MHITQGIYAIYKPPGITSHDVVNRVRRLSGEKRVGHGGTLDPFACGVLVVGIGREYTKQLHDILLHSTKVYRACIHLGATSTTDDPEGEITPQTAQIPALEEVKRTLKSFEGDIEQMPPAFSALKVQGKPAYQLARAGKKVELKARNVKIEHIKILRYDYPELEIEVTCHSGVYIRALARDIGQALNTGAYCKELERTRVGEYRLENALRIF